MNAAFGSGRDDNIMKKMQKTIGNVKIAAKHSALAAAIVITAGTLSGCYFFPKEEAVLAPPLIESTEITYETIDAKKGTIEKRITGSGTFVSAEQQNLDFKYRGGYISGIYVNLGDKVKKGDLLAEQDTDKLVSQIKQQEIILKRTNLDYESLKNDGSDPVAIEKARLNVELEKLKLEDLQLELDKSRIVSPIAGEIVYIDKLNVGDYVNARKTVITVADPSKLVLEYTGDNASEFQLGMNVDVKYKDKTYQGEVIMTPATAPLDIAESLKKTVRIRVDGLPSDVEIGASANLSLILQRRESTIVLPKNVISRSFGRITVQVLDNGIKYERDIEIGIETPTEVEVLKGIEEGEKVIIR